MAVRAPCAGHDSNHQTALNFEKKFLLHQGYTLQFKAEAFNLTDTAIFAGPSTSAMRSPRGGNDEEWKAWKTIEPASHPYHSSCKSLRDSYTPPLRRRDRCFKTVARAQRVRSFQHRKGLVTDVSGPQRNVCPGTLTPERGLVSLLRARQRTRTISRALREGKSR
jgi:hypothetical protein